MLICFSFCRVLPTVKQPFLVRRCTDYFIVAVTLFNLYVYRFWEACQQLKQVSQKDVEETVKGIYRSVVITCKIYL